MSGVKSYGASGKNTDFAIELTAGT